VYNDMPLAKAQSFIPKMSPQSVKSFNDKIVSDSYKHMPMTYVLCTRDNCLTPEWQEGRVAWLNSQRQDPLETVRLDADHFPQLGATEATAKVIADVIAGL
jgi:hypothetical protein